MVKVETEAPAPGRKPSATATPSALDKRVSPRLDRFNGRWEGGLGAAEARMQADSGRVGEAAGRLARGASTRGLGCPFLQWPLPSIGASPCLRKTLGGAESKGPRRQASRSPLPRNLSARRLPGSRRGARWHHARLRRRRGLLIALPSSCIGPAAPRPALPPPRKADSSGLPEPDTSGLP